MSTKKVFSVVSNWKSSKKNKLEEFKISYIAIETLVKIQIKYIRKQLEYYKFVNKSQHKDNIPSKHENKYTLLSDTVDLISLDPINRKFFTLIRSILLNQWFQTFAKNVGPGPLYLILLTTVHGPQTQW